MLTGENTLEKARSLRDELINITTKGRFELKQWVSNESKLIESLRMKSDPSNHLLLGQQEDVGITVEGHARYYTLLLKTKGKGAQGDKKGNTPSSSSIDPLGLLGPGIVQAKLILQELWKFRVKWDDNGIGMDRATFV